MDRVTLHRPYLYPVSELQLPLQMKARRKSSPLLFLPRLLISLRFTSTRQLPCTFKKLCQILIKVFSNSLVSLLILPKHGGRRKEPAWRSCVLWAAIRRSVWSSLRNEPPSGSCCMPHKVNQASAGAPGSSRARRPDAWCITSRCKQTCSRTRRYQPCNRLEVTVGLITNNEYKWSRRGHLFFKISHKLENNK